MTTGTVITFYSYKGGVGRTLLLANAAVLLARWGFRVLCVDFDLEAPGLHKYFAPYQSSPETRGIVDMVLGHVDGQPLSWTDLIGGVDIQGCEGRLHLLRTGQGQKDQDQDRDQDQGQGQDADYHAQLRRLDWDALYEDHDFGAELERWRREWTEGIQSQTPGASSTPYDFVLVDSRTGLTDLQGICTAQLPDVLVFLFTANAQSLDGATAVVDRARKQRDRLPLDRPPFLALPVPSRCDFDEHPALANAWLGTFALALGRYYDDWRHASVSHDRLLQLLRIEYRSVWSFGEPLPVLDESVNDSAGWTYRAATITAFLARRLAHSDRLAANRDGYVQDATAAKVLRSPQRYEYEFFLSYARQDAAYVRELRAALERLNARCWMDNTGIAAGKRLLATIERGIESSRDLVFLSGASSIKSRWQKMELLRFEEEEEADESRRIIPVWRAGKLPASLSTRRHVDARTRSAADVARDILADRDRHPGALAPAPVVEAQDPITAWRQHLRAAHARLIPFFTDADPKLLAEVYVELDMAVCEPRVSESRDGVRAEQRLDGRQRLRELIEAPTEDGIAGRWVVVGEPGCGKTTTLRHLAWTLSDEPDSPVPVFLSLARHGAAAGDPFKLAAAELGDGRLLSGSLSDALRSLAQTPGSPGQARVWLLLDGLDEVSPGGAMESAARWIRALARDHPHMVIVVSTRPIALERHGLGQRFQRAHVRPLGPAAQEALLDRLLPDDEAMLVKSMLREPSNHALAELGRNPLMLSLIAMVGREAGARGGTLPRHRVELYDQAIELVLRRGHGDHATGVKDPRLARRLLRALALDLQGRKEGGEAWTTKELDDALWTLRRADEDLSFRVEKTWSSNDELLDDLGYNGGVLGPHDGPGAPWRFLHRSLREFLAAEALSEFSDTAIDAWAQGWMDSIKRQQMRKRGEATKAGGAEPARWGEVFTLLCGLVADPLRRLEQLREVDKSGELPRRALRAVEGLTAGAAIGFLLETKGWEARELVDLVLTLDSAKAQEALWARVVPSADTELLAALHCALVRVGAEPERERFFQACERWPEAGRPSVPTAPIPDGEFWMGSPEDERHRSNAEGPRHRVRITRPFAMGTTPVTRAQYRAFDPSIGADDPNLPVTGVSWYQARLFCAWVEGRLPTEAEWEYACRAGTETTYWFGNKPADLERAAWYGGKTRGAQPVAGKDANPWGLYDVHGNVWEWCEDGFDAEYYASSPADDPKGPSGRALRVLRGGSWDHHAMTLRCACRFRFRPGYRYDYIGFRVVCRLPPSTVAP